MKPHKLVVRLVGQLVMLAFCVFGVLASSALALDTVEAIRFGLATREWQGRSGTVESSWVQEGRKEAHDWPRIIYRYETGGRIVRSDEIGAWGEHDTAQSLVAAYPDGVDVIVYHDPESGMSVLGRGVDSDDYVQLGVWAVFLALAAGGAAWLVLEALPWIGVRRPFGTDRLFAPKPPRANSPVRGAGGKIVADEAMALEIIERRREREKRAEAGRR